jgi:arabinose-5-phosphate isomerase
MGCKVIAFTGNKNSTLARYSDIVIDVGVEREACPLGLVPTASTTALLAIGDALAVVLINKRDFKSSDFRKIHPGGVLGQRLSSKVKDIMIKDESLPLVYEGVSFHEAVLKIDSGGLGAVLVVKKGDTLSGIITDGDIRRTIAKKGLVHELKAEEVMTKNPRTAGPDSPAYDALYLMERFQITVLPITDPGNKILGVLHLHDILGKGSFSFKPSFNNNRNNEMP